MTLASPNTGILIVNTSPVEEGGQLDFSGRRFAEILGEQFAIRTLSALGDLDGPVPENGIIFNGSPHSVLGGGVWLEKYRVFIKEMIAQRKAVLGVCFGHEILADVFGGTVAKAQTPQIGPRTVTLTDSGLRHPLFRDVPREMLLPASHFEHVTELGPQGNTLATSAQSAHYAFEAPTPEGGFAWGIQFHPEMTSIRLSEVIYENYNHVPDWEMQLRDAAETDFGTHGTTIIKNYGEAVVRSKSF